MVYTYSFTAAIPNFRCINPLNLFDDYNNETLNEIYNEEYRPNKDECLYYKKSISLKECQRCFIYSNNSLKSCQIYVYDRKYYKQTLTEEVKFIYLNIFF